MAEKEYTLGEIAEHNTEKSCWLIIGNATNGGPKVYDVTKYLDDHPGGAEVMLDVAGQDADEFFEDIGHSNDARAELKKYEIGMYKMDAATIAKLKAEAEAKEKSSGGSSMMMVMVAVVAVLAIVFGYLRTQEDVVTQEL